MKRFTTKRLAPNVLEVRFDKAHAGDKFYVMCRSDAHHDNLHCDQKLEKKHLDQAVELGAGILDHGDLFCAMQGKWDPRADPKALRHELQGGNYLDELVRYNTSFYQPYADNFLMISPGNHCTSVKKRHETCLTTRFAEHIAAKTGTNIPVMTYCGWVQFRFTIGTCSETINYYWHHGFGGGGPVTKGTIQASRMAAYLENARICYTGHTHDEWIFNNFRHGISRDGKTYNERQWFLRAPGYKDEFSCSEGYHIEKGRGPKGLGAIMLEFELHKSMPKEGEKQSCVNVNARLMI